MSAPMLTSQNTSVWFRIIPSLGVDVMTLLFNRLDGAYPNVWRANFKTTDSIANLRECWADAFDDEGMTPDDVKAGLKACRRLHDMPPSLTQFMKACRPGISADSESMFHRAVSEMTKRRAGKPQDWPTPGLFWAAAHIGGDILTAEYRHIKGQWSAALDAHGRRTDPVPETPVAALPAPRMTAEQAAQRLTELGVAGQVLRPASASSSGGILLDWAERIAKDAESGQASAYAGKMAAEALRNSRRKVPASLVQFLPKPAA